MTASVILCAFNPDRRLLDWALDSLARRATRHDIVLVDNNSNRRSTKRNCGSATHWISG
jgi:glycosyltransferase involved in cell wall biosynthesis